MSRDNHIIFFDGVCNLCNSTVQFVIEHDKKNLFKFASLQSPFGQKFLKGYNLPISHFNSFIYYRNGKVYTQSSAALYVARDLGGIWSLAFAFIIVPKFIRDAVYNLIAKNRYKWFGKKESCMIPTPDLKNKFIVT